MALIDEPCTDGVPLLAPRRAERWVDEALVAEVRCLERTPSGLLRHESAQTVRST
jgi:hypothetical protein